MIVIRVSLMPWRDWRAENAHLFPTDISMRWSIRQHRKTYVGSGALLEIGGRLFVDPSKMDAAIRTIGTNAALSRTK